MRLFLWFFSVTLVWGGIAGTKSISQHQFSAAPATASDVDNFEIRVASWRSKGPDGLEELLAKRDALVQPLGVSKMALSRNETTGEIAELNRLIDAVCGQVHGSVSRLFWYTDVDEAKRAAAQTGKPILSLRLLGKLNEELSCANSRFFRAILYANRQVSDYLRTHYVLQWESVRPVPVTTIDFGDGRKIVTTVTGNSVHFVLDANGRPLDAIPGLYSPTEFLAQLQRDLQLEQVIRGLSAETRGELLRQHHQNRLAEMQVAFKNLVEPVYRDRGAIPTLESTSMTDEIMWLSIVGGTIQTTMLDATSESLINSLKPTSPTALNAAKLTRLKLISEAILIDRFAQSLRVAIADDSLRNEFVLHRQLHSWFITDTEIDTAKLTSRIYAELFLTPLDDPWMGLVDGQAFSGLRDNGMIIEKEEPTESTAA